MSPLGELYRREAARLRRRYPTMEAEQIDRLVTLSLARAFLDLDAAELSCVMEEASQFLKEQSPLDAASYSATTVAEVLTLIAKEDDDSHEAGIS